MKIEKGEEGFSGDLIGRVARGFADAAFEFRDRWISGGWIGRSLEQWNQVREERFHDRLRQADAEAFDTPPADETYKPADFFMGYNPRSDQFRVIDPDTEAHFILSRDEIDRAWGRGTTPTPPTNANQYSFDWQWPSKDQSLTAAFREAVNDLNGIEEHGVGFDPDWGEARLMCHDPTLDAAFRRVAHEAFEKQWGQQMPAERNAAKEPDGPDFDR